MLTQFQITFENSDAYLFARAYHAGQVYHNAQGDEDYLNHPVRVAKRLSEPRLQVKALLHDVVEDTAATLDDIRAEFGEDVADSVDALTKREGEDYRTEYLPRLVRDYDALLVKIADVDENMSCIPMVFPVISHWATLWRRYTVALDYLKAARDIYPTLQRLWNEGQPTPSYDLVLEIKRLQAMAEFDQP